MTDRVLARLAVVRIPRFLAVFQVVSSRHHAAPGGVRPSQPSNPEHCAVSGPACRLRCRPTGPAPPNRLLRKLLAAEGLPRAARRQARNPRGLRPLGHARPPTRTHRHLGAASHRARYAGEADPDRTPAPLVHQIGVQTQGLPTVCCLCTTQIGRTATPRRRVWRRRVDRPASLAGVAVVEHVLRGGCIRVVGRPVGCAAPNDAVDVHVGEERHFGVARVHPPHV